MGFSSLVPMWRTDCPVLDDNDVDRAGAAVLVAAVSLTLPAAT
jgi:hypothetical protein